MSRIFLSHSSVNNADAVGLRDWLKREGWDDVFLDVDPDRGIAAGQRWERALNEAAHRCEAVLFCRVARVAGLGLVCQRVQPGAPSKQTAVRPSRSKTCAVADLPVYLTSTWQLVRLCSGRDHVMLRVTMPHYRRRKLTSPSRRKASCGSRPAYSAPASIPGSSLGRQTATRTVPPYRGLRPLEAEDAGIFFGRDAPIVEALDRLRGLRDAAPPRLLVILGASGAGKSSFLARRESCRGCQRDDRELSGAPGGAAGAGGNKSARPGWCARSKRRLQAQGSCAHTGRHQVHDRR